MQEQWLLELTGIIYYVDISDSLFDKRNAFLLIRITEEETQIINRDLHELNLFAIISIEVVTAVFVTAIEK